MSSTYQTSTSGFLPGPTLLSVKFLILNPGRM